MHPAPHRAGRLSLRRGEASINRRQHWLALIAVVLLHGLFAVVAWYGMRTPAPRPPAPLQPEEIMQVRLISQASPAKLPPPPEALSLPPAPAPAKPPQTPPHHEPPAPEAMQLQPPPTRADALQLYDEHGQPRLPAAAASAPTPGYVQHTPQGDAGIMQHRSPVDYQATRFEQDWRGGGNAFDSALQKLVDKTTVKKTIRLPGGIRIHCAVALAMLAGGCGGDPPPPPSAKDGDERLNMAPASSLDGHAHGAKPPAIEACIAMYRAGKPLAWGCPVDTPDRAVDAELHERAAGAATQP